MANLYDNMRKARKKRKKGKKTAGVKSKTYNQMKNNSDYSTLLDKINEK